MAIGDLPKAGESLLISKALSPLVRSILYPGFYTSRILLVPCRSFLGS